MAMMLVLLLKTGGGTTDPPTIHWVLNHLYTEIHVDFIFALGYNPTV